MKKAFKYMVALTLFFGVSATTVAQTNDEVYPNTFISVQGGVQTTFTNYDNLKLITPQYAFSVGHWFSPTFGARLHFMGYDIKGALPASELCPDYKYKYKAITGNADFLVNMSNIICPNRTGNKFNWILLAGFGTNLAWDLDDYKEHAPLYPNYSIGKMPYGNSATSFNGRLGTIIEYNFTRNFAANLELQANYKNDRFNLKMNEKVDWQAVALLGVTVRFGQPKVNKPAPVVEEPIVEEPAPVQEVVKPEPKPEPKPIVKPEPLKETVYYEIRESELNNEVVLNNVVAWCNKYPEKNITVSGYADKGTGNPDINMKYSEERATKVADAIKAKGISADRISVHAYGDTVQPFAENDLNRCVIVVGE